MCGRSWEQEGGGRSSCRMVRGGPVEKRLTGDEMRIIIKEVSSLQGVRTSIAWSDMFFTGTILETASPENRVKGSLWR